MGRNSYRLKRFDYSQPGEYFVTLCTHERRPLFGRIVGGRMLLSAIGALVETMWKQIPDHFGVAQTGAFQVMPDHVHGVVIIVHKESKTDAAAASSAPFAAEYIQPPPMAGLRQPRAEEKERRFQHVTPNSLESIMRSFKAAVTREAHRLDLYRGNIWRRSFHDRIIRCDVARFFIDQYIGRNPLMWEIRMMRNASGGLSLEKLREWLQREHGLTGDELDQILERASRG